MTNNDFIGFAKRKWMHGGCQFSDHVLLCHIIDDVSCSHCQQGGRVGGGRDGNVETDRLGIRLVVDVVVANRVDNKWRGGKGGFGGGGVVVHGGVDDVLDGDFGGHGELWVARLGAVELGGGAKHGKGGWWAGLGWAVAWEGVGDFWRRCGGRTWWEEILA